MIKREFGQKLKFNSKQNKLSFTSSDKKALFRIKTKEKDMLNRTIFSSTTTRRLKGEKKSMT